MQNAGTTGSYTSISDHYAVLIQSICDISESYHYLGKFGDALNILKIGEQLARSNEVRQREKTKLLLQYSKILINNYFITNQDYDLTLSTALQAKQVTEDVHDEQGTADALDLIGQAYYYKSINTSQGDFDKALKHFQQALERRETLQDTRGMSESLFHVGLIYQNGDQSDIDKASDYFMKALQLAEQHNYKLEASYAARHLASIFADKEDPRQGLKFALESLTLREDIGFKRTFI